MFRRYSLGNFLAGRNTLWLTENAKSQKKSKTPKTKWDKPTLNLGKTEEAYAVGRLKEMVAAKWRRLETDLWGLTLTLQGSILTLVPSHELLLGLLSVKF